MNSYYSDQTEHMPRLGLVFPGCISHFLCLLVVVRARLLIVLRVVWFVLVEKKKKMFSLVQAHLFCMLS